MAVRCGAYLPGQGSPGELPWGRAPLPWGTSSDHLADHDRFGSALAPSPRQLVSSCLLGQVHWACPSQFTNPDTSAALPDRRALSVLNQGAGTNPRVPHAPAFTPARPLDAISEILQVAATKLSYQRPCAYRSSQLERLDVRSSMMPCGTVQASCAAQDQRRALLQLTVASIITNKLTKGLL